MAMGLPRGRTGETAFGIAATRLRARNGSGEAGSFSSAAEVVQQRMTNPRMMRARIDLSLAARPTAARFANGGVESEREIYRPPKARKTMPSRIRPTPNSLLRVRGSWKMKRDQMSVQTLPSETMG